MNKFFDRFFDAIGDYTKSILFLIAFLLLLASSAYPLYNEMSPLIQWAYGKYDWGVTAAKIVPPALLGMNFLAFQFIGYKFNKYVFGAWIYIFVFICISFFSSSFSAFEGADAFAIKKAESEMARFSQSEFIGSQYVSSYSESINSINAQISEINNDLRNYKALGIPRPSPSQRQDLLNQRDDLIAKDKAEKKIFDNSQEIKRNKFYEDKKNEFYEYKKDSSPEFIIFLKKKIKASEKILMLLVALAFTVACDICFSYSSTGVSNMFKELSSIRLKRLEGKNKVAYKKNIVPTELGATKNEAVEKTVGKAAMVFDEKMEAKFLEAKETSKHSHDELNESISKLNGALDDGLKSQLAKTDFLVRQNQENSNSIIDLASQISELSSQIDHGLALELEAFGKKIVGDFHEKFEELSSRVYEKLEGRLEAFNEKTEAEFGRLWENLEGSEEKLNLQKSEGNEILEALGDVSAKLEGVRVLKKKSKPENEKPSKSDIRNNFVKNWILKEYKEFGSSMLMGEKMFEKIRHVIPTGVNDKFGVSVNTARPAVTQALNELFESGCGFLALNPNKSGFKFIVV